MSASLSRREVIALAGLAGLTVTGALAGCSNADPLASPSAPVSPEGTATGALVVGSQAYYSNEIIAEIYAQALEASGVAVERQYQIGQRAVYIPEIEAGRIDVLPEYGGNLLQYYDSSAAVTDTASIVAALANVLPPDLRVLASAEASDQDSYTVTRAFAAEHGLTSIGDLAGLADLRIAANSEFRTRPYGPDGVKAAYGVDVTLVPVEDSGGPLTVSSLTGGTVQIADIYTADPAIVTHDLVVLEDPQHLILPQNVLPLVSRRVDAGAAAVLDAVSAKLTSAELRAVNARSVSEQLRSATIASEWLAAQGLR